MFYFPSSNKSRESQGSFPKIVHWNIEYYKWWCNGDCSVQRINTEAIGHLKITYLGFHNFWKEAFVKYYSMNFTNGRSKSQKRVVEICVRGKPSGHRLREFIQTCLSVRQEKWLEWKSRGPKAAGSLIDKKIQRNSSRVGGARNVISPLFPAWGLRTDNIVERGETLGRVAAKGVKIVPRPLSLPCLDTSRYTFDLHATIIPIRKQSRFQRRPCAQGTRAFTTR